MTRTRTLEKIVGHCLAMDRAAVEVYARFGALPGADPRVAEFWREMAAEEREHAALWESLLELVRDRETPSLFPHPERTLRALAAQRAQVAAIESAGIRGDDVRGQFLLAFRLEFYVLHPALERLLGFSRLLRGAQRTPELDYEGHIRRFLAALRGFGAGTPELELLGEAVLRLWVELREATREAALDTLTPLLNRRGLLERMRTLAYLSRRNAFTAGALLIDIDHFKRINDTYGHATGDEVLVKVARIISGSVRKSDLVGRFGGEEFLVFLPQIEAEGLHGLGEKVRVAVEDGTRDRIAATVSVGAACADFSEGVGPGLTTLLRDVDTRLYHAKRAGRNRVAASLPG